MPARSVFLIEDDPIVRDSIAYVLRDNEFQVLEAETPARLGDDVSAPDCIVLDLGATGPPGIAILRKRFPHTRIVVISGQLAASAFDTALNAGADACIRKPFKPVDLLRIITGADTPRGAA